MYNVESMKVDVMGLLIGVKGTIYNFFWEILYLIQIK